MEVALQGCRHLTEIAGPLYTQQQAALGGVKPGANLPIYIWHWSDNQLQEVKDDVFCNQGKTLQLLTAGGHLLTTLPAAGQQVLP